MADAFAKSGIVKGFYAVPQDRIIQPGKYYIVCYFAVVFACQFLSFLPCVADTKCEYAVWYC